MSIGTRFCGVGALGDAKFVGCTDQGVGFAREVDAKTLPIVFGVQLDYHCERGQFATRFSSTWIAASYQAWGLSSKGQPMGMLAIMSCMSLSRPQQNLTTTRCPWSYPACSIDSLKSSTYLSTEHFP
jgi:hypothetical protein